VYFKVNLISVIQKKSFVLYFVAFLFDVMAEGVPSATGGEQVKEKLLIWCGKRNKTPKTNWTWKQPNFLKVIISGISTIDNYLSLYILNLLNYSTSGGKVGSVVRSNH
jgi:hypothetical protein